MIRLGDDKYRLLNLRWMLKTPSGNTLSRITLSDSKKITFVMGEFVIHIYQTMG
jgi:hypothetical protein